MFATLTTDSRLKLLNVLAMVKKQCGSSVLLLRSRRYCILDNIPSRHWQLRIQVSPVAVYAVFEQKVWCLM